MATEYTKATDADFDELRDLANYVFKLDFEELLPKLYRSEHRTAPWHHIAREDGRIKSVVGQFPLEFSVAGNKLKIGGIGTVSVHPYTRHKGYMKALMTRAMAEMETTGVDLGCLGGARQRYAYFGFEPCGQLLVCELTTANLQHSFGAVGGGGIALAPVAREDSKTIAAMKALHDAQTVHVTRADGLFYDTLCSWKCQVWAIRRNDALIGYLVSSESHDTVKELVLANPGDLKDVAGAFLVQNNRKWANFQVHPWDKEKVRFFEAVTERIQIIEDACFAVLHYRPVVAALMDLKAGYTTLADGVFTLNIEGKEAIRMEVKDGKPSVTTHDGPCDLSLPPLKAMRLLFSPFSGIHDFDVALPAAVRGWLPLPLGYPSPDEV